VLKGFAFGLPLTGVFVGLLSADVDFSVAVSRIASKLGEGVWFTMTSLLVVSGSLVAHALFQRRPIPDLGVGAQPDAAYRSSAATESRALFPTDPRVAASTWVMVIGQVALVFAVFVAVNVRGLFGGDALVRAPGSLTYAKYLHAGFGQLLFASVLSTCLVVAGHHLLRPRTPEGARGPVPGGALLATAECTLLGLTAITVASCAERLAIYEDAYGATRLRLGVAFIVLAVLATLALTVWKAIRRGWRSYGGALMSALVGIVVVASMVNADAYVARTNLDRAARGKPLDVAYLSWLSADAQGALAHPWVIAHPDVAAVLTAAYCIDRSGTDWRARRGIESCGR
jgi:hypothetical protein